MTSDNKHLEHAPAEKLARISTWQPVSVKRSFADLCAAQNRSESALLGQIVLQVLKMNPPAPAAQKELRGDTLHFRFPLKAKLRLQERAAQRGLTISEYCVSLILAHLTRTPIFTDTEFAQVRESNRQLAALGRNVNQLTKALNAIAAAGAQSDLGIDLDSLRQFSASDLKAQIQECRAAILRLSESNVKSWKIDNE